VGVVVDFLSDSAKSVSPLNDVGFVDGNESRAGRRARDGAGIVYDGHVGQRRFLRWIGGFDAAATIAKSNRRADGQYKTNNPDHTGVLSHATQSISAKAAGQDKSNKVEVFSPYGAYAQKNMNLHQQQPYNLMAKRKCGRVSASFSPASEPRASPVPSPFPGLLLFARRSSRFRRI
jgi:hypothetical protein